MPTPINNSVRKAFDILLTFVGQRGDLSARQVADLTGMNAATAHRFLISLESVGAISRTDGNRYQLGALMAELGGRVRRHRVLDAAVKPHIESLVAATRESVQVGVLSGARVLRLRASHADRSLQLSSGTGNIVPCHCSAMGKVLLSGIERGDRRAFIDELQMERFTDSTILDPDQLMQEIDATERRGYGVSDEEFEDGLFSVAIPIRDAHGRVLAALAVSGPSGRMTPEAVAAHLVHMREQVAHIQRKIYSTSVVVEGKAPPRGSFPHVKRTGDFIFVSGISSRRPDGSFEGARVTKSGKVQFDFRRQALVTLNNVIDVLAEAGAAPDDIADMTVYLTREQDYDGFNAVYSTHFSVEGPARSTVIVKKLPHKHQLIMIRAIAYKPQV